MKYLWTEDAGAGLHFWELVNQLFFDNAFVVESKGSNQGLLDALLKLSNEKSDYTEQDIVERKESIIDGFLQYLKNNELIG